MERGARSWEDITQAKEMKDDALFPCCFVCEEAEAWLIKSRTSNPIRAIQSQGGQRKLVWMAVGSALQTQSTLAMWECWWS